MIAYRGWERIVTNEMAFEPPLVFIAEGVCSDWRTVRSHHPKARLSVRGTRHPFQKKIGPSGSRHNRLDRIAKAHDIDYDKAKTLKDKWVADRKMIAKIDQLPGRKTLTERIVRAL